MNKYVIKSDSKFISTTCPTLKSGFTVKVHQKIKEGEKERVQIFEGLIIKISSGTGVSKTFTVRKVVDGVGVEKIFPINSPNVAKVEIVRASKVRRAKLYYLRKNRSFKLYNTAIDEESLPEAAPTAEKEVAAPIVEKEVEVVA